MSQPQQQPSKWGARFKTVNNAVFKQMDKVGAKVNMLSGKMGMEGFWPGPMLGEIEKCARILRTFTSDEVLETANPDDAKKTQKVLVKIPPKLIANAQGLAIFTVFRTGLGISAASGSGVVISRDNEGVWGPPSGILIHTLGFGFLAGADVYDVVLILRNRKAVNAFANPKVSLGAELSVAAGPLGAGAMLDTGLEAAPVLSYTKSKGIYGGAQVDGNIIIERTDENERFYGRPIKAKEILSETSRIEVPAGSEPLHIAIANASSKALPPPRNPQRRSVPPRVSGGGWVDENDENNVHRASGSSEEIRLDNGVVADKDEGKFQWQDAYESGSPTGPSRRNSSQSARNVVVTSLPAGRNSLSPPASAMTSPSHGSFPVYEAPRTAPPATTTFAEAYDSIPVQPPVFYSPPPYAPPPRSPPPRNPHREDSKNAPLEEVSLV